MIMSLLVWFLIGMGLSAFFSAAEMAFVSSDRVKMRKLADSKNRSAQRMLQLYDRPHHFLTTILIGNNIANVTATAVVTYSLSMYLGIESEWLVTAIMTPLLLIFAEVIPKDYCRVNPHHFLLSASSVLKGLSRMFYFLTTLILKVVDFFLAPLGGEQRRSIFVTEREFRFLVEESTRTGVVGLHEKRIIDTILDFEKMQVRQVMTTASEVPKIEIRDTVGAAKRHARETGAKMLLVYEEIPSIVVGMIYVFDLLFEDDENQGLKKFLRSPVFIQQNTSNEIAFFTLQQRRQSFAVVVDESREVVGVVAIEKLLAIGDVKA